MKKLIIALAVVAAIAPGVALAGGGLDCAGAVELFSDGVVNGDTSDNANVIGAFGPLSSTGPDAIYFFVAPAVPTDPITVELTGGFAGGGAVYLSSVCAGNSGTPVQVDAQPAGVTTLTLPLVNADNSQLTAGSTFFVVVSNSPADNAGGSGTYNLTTGTTPVALQSFSID